MKILGQHGQLDGPACHPPAAKPVERHVEIADGDRLSVVIREKLTDHESELFGYFRPGVLKLEWEGGAKLEDHDAG